MSDEDIHRACRIDPWFLEQIRGIIDTEDGNPRQGHADHREIAATAEVDGLL